MIVIKHEEETSDTLHLEHSFLEGQNLDTSEIRSHVS